MAFNIDSKALNISTHPATKEHSYPITQKPQLARPCPPWTCISICRQCCLLVKSIGLSLNSATCCVTLGVLFHISETQFLYL